jgi:hypothetical protein
MARIRGLLFHLGQFGVVYIVTSVRRPCYVYGSDLKHSKGGSEINKAN